MPTEQTEGQTAKKVAKTLDKTLGKNCRWVIAYAEEGGEPKMIGSANTPNAKLEELSKTLAVVDWSETWRYV